jgi:hypothetical protein
LIVSEQRVERLLRETQTTGLAAEVGELDPHLDVLARRDDQSADLEDSLPDFDVALTALESVTGCA